LQKQLKYVEDKEVKHTNRIAELEDEVRILSRPSENDKDALPTRELELQNSHLRNALERAKAELIGSAKKLQLFENAEHNLREEAEASKTQLQQMKNNLVKLESEKAETERKVRKFLIMSQSPLRSSYIF